jgi:epoxyqueuosine reductase
VELRKPIGDHFFGCDICQDVCPWNRKPLNQLLSDTRQGVGQPSQETLIQELREILTLSGKKLQKKFMGTPLMRAGSFGLRRNALVLMGNRKLTELKPEAEKYLQDPRLGELATWAIDQIKK